MYMKLNWLIIDFTAALRKDFILEMEVFSYKILWWINLQKMQTPNDTVVIKYIYLIAFD